MNTPLFKHDCEHCVYVKTDKDDFGTISDIYVCGNYVTFRYSNEPSDNRSICFDQEYWGKHYNWIVERSPYAFKILQDFKSLSNE